MCLSYQPSVLPLPLTCGQTLVAEFAIVISDDCQVLNILFCIHACDVLDGDVLDCDGNACDNLGFDYEDNSHYYVEDLLVLLQ